MTMPRFFHFFLIVPKATYTFYPNKINALRKLFVCVTGIESIRAERAISRTRDNNEN